MISTPAAWSACAFHWALAQFMGEDDRHLTWHRNTIAKLAFVARYGHVPPSEAAFWDWEDLHAFCDALGEMIEQENSSRS